MSDKDSYKNVYNKFPIRGSLNFISMFCKAAIEAVAIYVIIGYMVDDRIGLVQRQANHSLLDSSIGANFDFDNPEKSKPKLEAPIKEEKALETQTSPTPTPTPVKEKALTFKDAR